MSAKSRSIWGILWLITVSLASGCNQAVTDPTAAAALNAKRSDKAAPVTANALLTASQVTSSSLKLSWTAAVDNVTTATSLTYLAFYTTVDPGVSTPEVETVKSDWSAVGTASTDASVEVTSLTAGTTYFFTVLVADTAGNISVYSVLSQATTEAAESTTTTTTTTATADTTAPVLADSVLVASALSTAGLTLSWTEASDVGTVGADLNYQLYYSSYAM